MTVDHGSRGHATWSASASERLFNCPGSLSLNAGLPDKESEAAAWGTACHQVSEKCLRGGKDAIEFLGTTETTKAHSFEVDDEMAETAQVYVDYVRGRVNLAGDKDSPARLLIEQKFDLAPINPPFQAGGTGDAVILPGYGGMLEIVDLKGGRGVVVEATGNKQLRTYALGALIANPGDWKQIRVTIVQPRAPHKDGRIRSETFDVFDLFEWSADLLDAMAEAALAGRETGAKDWPARFLRAGTHCTFCKAAATCPALQKRSLEVAHTYFKPETGALSAPPDPATLTMEQVVRVLDHADMIGNWLNAVRAYAQDTAEMGGEVPGYVLVPKRANRKWNVEDPVTALASRTDKDPDDFYDVPKVLTPAKVEKLLGKKGYEAVKDLVVQESSGMNLVRSDKTDRAAVLAPPHQFFQPQA